MLVEQLLVLFIVSSFAYLVGVLIGRASDKEIRKNPKKFLKFDYYIWVIFMLLAMILAIYESWYAVIGILVTYLIIFNAKKKIHRFTVLPLILGLSAAFRNDFFVLLLSLGTFYTLIFGMIKHKDNQIKIVFKNQMRYIILILIGLFIPIIVNTVFELSQYQLQISCIIIGFLASMVLVGEHEHFFAGKSLSRVK